MKKFFYLFIAALTLIACGDGNDPNAIKLSKYAERIGLAGGSVTVELTSPSAWSATASEDWVTINPSSGQGDAFVKITVTPGSKATATIIFVNANGSVKMAIARSDDEGDTPQNPDPQDPPTPDTPDPSVTFSVTPSTINAFVAGGTYELSINTNAALWEASCEQPWAHLSATAGVPSQYGRSYVTVTVDQATSKAETSQKITFKVGKNTYYVPINRQGLGNFNSNIPSPTGLTVEKVLASNHLMVDHMHLSWQPVAGAIKYNVYREDVCLWNGDKYGYEDGDLVMPNTVIATVTETQFDDTDSKKGGGSFDVYLNAVEMSVRYSVTAVTSSGESVPCQQVRICWDEGA